MQKIKHWNISKHKIKMLGHCTLKQSSRRRGAKSQPSWINKIRLEHLGTFEYHM